MSLFIVLFREWHHLAPKTANLAPCCSPVDVRLHTDLGLQLESVLSYLSQCMLGKRNGRTPDIEEVKERKQERFT